MSDRPRTPHLLALALASGLALLPAGSARAASGFALRAVALEGAPAPGTGDAFGALFAVSIDASGRVAFGAPLASGFPAAGVWVDTGSGPALLARNGDPAPPPQTGSYLAFGGATGQGGGSVATPAILDTGVNGLFALSGAGEVIVAEGDPAPVTPAGSFDAGLAEIGTFGVNASADVVFVSGIDGGARRGVFLRNAAGMIQVAGDGDAVGAGPETFVSFAHPALNGSGHVVFAAGIAGGAASSGLFLDTGSGAEPLAYAGDAAPGTGGGTFSSFLYPAIASDGRVAFLSEVVGGSASAGLFVASPAVASVLVEGQSVPEAGPVDLLSSLPTIAADGSLAMSLGFASGPVAGGVYVYDGDGFTPAALAGELAPDSGGAHFASFGMLGRNDSGRIAFVATLDDARTGVFVATPPAPAVPGLPIGAVPIVALLLTAGGAAMRRGRPAPSGRVRGR